MDLWVVAAAAGAGYLAKHWQNIFKDNDESGLISERSFLDEPQSPSFIKRIRDKPWPIKKFSPPRLDIGKGDLFGEIFTETSTNSVALNHEEVEWLDDGSVTSQYVFSSESRNDKEFEEYTGGDIYEDNTWEMGDLRALRRNKSSVRRRRLQLQSIKPHTSLDSCLMAQMYREHVELETYLLTPLSSPVTPSLGPFLVSNEKRLISESSVAFKNGLHEEVYPEMNNEVVGVPGSPQIQQ